MKTETLLRAAKRSLARDGEYILVQASQAQGAIIVRAFAYRGDKITVDGETYACVDFEKLECDGTFIFFLRKVKP